MITKTNLFYMACVLFLFLLISEEIATTTEHYFFIGLGIGCIVGFNKHSEWLSRRRCHDKDSI